MNYKEIISYLFNNLPFFQKEGKQAYKADLSNAHKMDQYFNHPHHSFKTIHIGGTNGKGSVSHILASILQAAGYKVGLYTSPHIIEFRERIRINGKKIKKQFVSRFVSSHQSFFEKIKPSFFEISVFMAFKYFEEQNIDIAVVEVGLGGRLDTTNIINPLVSAITTIDLDHTDILGETKTHIAKEKAGIIKKETPIIIGESNKEIDHIFQKTADKLNAPIQFADQRFSFKTVKKDITNGFTYDIYQNENIMYPNVNTDLRGNFQGENVLTSLAVLKQISNTQLKISEKDIRKGLAFISKYTGLSGRLQPLSKNPLVICDVAHNKAGLRKTLHVILESKYNKLHIVFGLVKGKPLEDIFEIMPKDARYYFTKADSPRSMDENILHQRATALGFKGDTYNNVKNAYSTALKNSNNDDIIFIGGSTFIIQEIPKYSTYK